MESNHRLFAVVTGASSGIGYELARVFAKNGYDLLVTSGSDGAEEAARDFGSLGTEVQSVQADLATYEGVEKLWQAIQAAGRPIDAIAINAGVGVGGKFAETDLQQELKLIQLNVTSTVHLAKYVVREMLARGVGTDPVYVLYCGHHADTLGGGLWGLEGVWVVLLAIPAARTEGQRDYCNRAATGADGHQFLPSRWNG